MKGVPPHKGDILVETHVYMCKITNNAKLISKGKMKQQMKDANQTKHKYKKKKTTKVLGSVMGHTP